MTSSWHWEQTRIVWQGGEEGEAAAKRPSATHVRWVKAAPEQQS